MKMPSKVPAPPIEATGAPIEKQNMDLYDNASLIRLGVSNLKKIQVDKL